PRFSSSSSLLHILPFLSIFQVPLSYLPLFVLSFLPKQMDPLSRIPFECLQCILTILQQQRASNTLAALACTNKYIASVTIPILYCDPYFLSDCRPKDKNTHPPQGPQKYDHLLTRTLFSCHKEFSSFPRILSSAYELHLPETLSPSSSSQDYLSHVRHLKLTRQHQGLFYSRALDPPELATYVQSDTEFGQMMQVQFPLPEIYLHMFTDRNICHRRFYRQIILFRETFWALTNPILEQLRSLTIPLSLIERYLSVIDRFECLDTVDFLPDIVYTFYEEDIDEAAKARRIADWRAVVGFVQHHTRLFRGVLKTVTYGSFRIWPSTHYYHGCDEETQIQILRLLPPTRIIRLEGVSWNQYVAHPLETDLSLIDGISCMDRRNPWTQGIQDDPLIIQRCRSLKSLELISPGQGGFRWAVQEKRRAESFDGSTFRNSLYYCRNGQETSTQYGFQWPSRQQGLLPLAEVKIREGAIPLTDEVDDIAVGFSRTLTKLKAATTHPNDNSSPSQSLPHRLIFGRGWVNLPLLRDLSLESHYGPLAIDSHLLTNCPNLVNVWISDRTVDYKYDDDIAPWQLQQPAELSKVEQLSLTGLSALTFHPDTLHTTAKLTHLLLQTAPNNTIPGGEKWYIPPVEEMDRFYNLRQDMATKVEGENETGGLGELNIELQQPPPRRWSWNWNLPHLNRLHLFGEFAYRFEFRMLQGCPGLGNLWLDISTVGDDYGTHQRLLSSAELFASRIDLNNDGDEEYLPLREQHQQQERIVARSVYYLCLLGRWIMDDAFLQEFLPGMFPNLSELQVDKNSSFTAAGLFKVVKESMPAMDVLTVGEYDPSPEEADALGLDRVPDKDDDGNLRTYGIFHVEGKVHVRCRFEDFVRDFKLDRSK
ncbi:MAG: hypothetical protein JOS17DRAFT_832809, partial [Linnemannia elongata]